MGESARGATITPVLFTTPSFAARRNELAEEDFINTMAKVEIDSKKCRRKILRCLSSLKADTGIIEAHYPCKNLFIGNAGLTTGLDEESVVELFSLYGSLENVVLVPGKQYSFVCFGNVESAEHAYETIHGVVGIRGSRFPLYLAYVEEVPGIKSGVEYKIPPGLKVVEDFISVTEEQELLQMINWNCQPIERSQGQTLKHRQVRHFGYEFQYGSNLVNVNEPLPEGIPAKLSPVLDRLVQEGHMKHKPDQMTVNFYQPGQGIPPHIDTISCFTGEIISLSTGSGVLMDFRHKDGKHYAVYLPPRSLCVMTGPSR
ncbi:tRNA (carboxymethyluridine(34)-5-O)-methyltransferase ALKBH8-like isoform X2 [Oratosquilla oratoria]|uniref:tRNA (carboxymethyluridine(34)-5-O)-methyltransferase ALKBH8-like isoform X2 n=1 Tax=Oratosquilla oratoria TaxID=337810 RepID=UPI003F778010